MIRENYSEKYDNSGKGSDFGGAREVVHSNIFYPGMNSIDVSWRLY